MSCHAATGGPTLDGGDAIRSAFGRIYAPNITPDNANDIGDWSEEDFYKVMHEGVAKNGEYLYPAFPYHWFTVEATREGLAVRTAFCIQIE